MEINEIFAKRLKSARIMSKISMDELCKRIDGLVTKQAISKYESGKMLPGEDVQAKMAVALNVDVNYFFRPITCPTENFQVEFRKKSSMRISDVKAIQESIRDKIERYLELESLLGIHNEIDIPENLKTVFNKDDARENACIVREAWHLGSENSLGVLQPILESHGIKVLLVKVDSNFDGLSGTIIDNYSNKHNIIVINETQKHIERRRLTVVHELAHLLLDIDDSVTSHDKESICHAFANEMLMPTSAFKRAFPKLRNRIELPELRALQVTYGISIDALMKKAQEVEVITQSQYTTFNIVKNQSKAFKDAVEKSVFVEPPLYDRFSELVLTAYAQGIISKEKATSLLYDADEVCKSDLLAI